MPRLIHRSRGHTLDEMQFFARNFARKMECQDHDLKSALLCRPAFFRYRFRHPYLPSKPDVGFGAYLYSQLRPLYSTFTTASVTSLVMNDLLELKVYFILKLDW